MFTDTARVIHALALPDEALDEDPLDPSQVVSGSPQVRVLAVHDSDELAVGVWQHGPGVSRDVEADEVFVVLAGRASIAVEGGPVLEVAAGDIGLLPRGASTTWTVHETLRKVYVIRP